MFPRHLRSRFWRKFVITVDVVGADPRSNGRANRSRYIFRHSDRSKHSNRIRYWHARYVSDPSLPFAVAWSKHPKSVEHLAGRIVERSVKPYHWLEREREKRRRRKGIKKKNKKVRKILNSLVGYFFFFSWKILQRIEF